MNVCLATKIKASKNYKTRAHIHTAAKREKV